MRDTGNHNLQVILLLPKRRNRCWQTRGKKTVGQPRVIPLSPACLISILVSLEDGHLFYSFAMVKNNFIANTSFFFYLDFFLQLRPYSTSLLELCLIDCSFPTQSSSYFLLGWMLQEYPRSFLGALGSSCFSNFALVKDTAPPVLPQRLPCH